jgi:NADPH:quinone reductase-like Zn-dependent oxidoreductase
MRAVQMTAVGGPEVLRLAEVPEPRLAGDRDVKVRLAAAGVNPVDYKLRSSGTLGGPLPAVLGWDGAGVVEATGPGVTRFRAAPAVFGWDAHRERQRKILEQAAARFDAGELRIQVGATFPLERAADAHRALEAGQVIGKIVLTMDN